MSESDEGLVIVYTGRGKGKTTAALGLAMRAAGQDRKVCVVQFLKGMADCGEHRFVAKYGAFPIVQFVDESCFEAPADRQIAGARKALAYAYKAITGPFDVIILDEVISAINKGYITESDLGRLLEARPPGTDLIITGRDAPEAIIAQADLVTEMTEIKHPFKRGRRARKGIDY